MKRKFVQIAASCLAAALLLVCAAGGQAYAVPAATAQRVIRVGLHYGTGAMEGLNLENKEGSGFRFGYYDRSEQFVELGSTPQQAISVAETMNVYYGTYDGYSSYHTALTASSVAVGEYHLELPGTYGTFAEAQLAASAYDGGFPACIGGVFRARIGNYTIRDRAVAAQSALAAQGVTTTLVGTSSYGVNAVITGTSTILFQYDDLGQGTGLGVEPNQFDTGGQHVTWSKGYQYSGGFRFERINGGKMTVVNILGLDDYVKGVVPFEMGDDWPMEALKAQAVAVRSYALTSLGKHGAHHFDVCYSVDCQAYSGRTMAGANSDAAVDLTAGQVAISGGQTAQTFYYSSNGGASESVSTVWGSNQATYPYLVGVVDPHEAYLTSLNNSWTRTFTSSQIISRVLSQYNVSGSIVSAAVTAHTATGNPKTITFTDSTGKNFTVSSASVFKNLGLPSFRFGFEGSGTSSQPTPQPPSTPSGSVSINGSSTVDSISGLYAIDGYGSMLPLGGGEICVITDSGISTLDQGQQGGAVQPPSSWADSATAVNGSITFAGRGSGHNIGMSQWGAYAMAQQGYTYLEILQFYYTGITVGYM